MGAGGKRKGAGRPAHKGLTDDCLALSIALLHSQKLLTVTRGFTIDWREGATITASIGVMATASKFLQLYFTANQIPVSQRINLSNTSCYFGGVRFWFECPNCSCRAGVLFMRNLRFACRHCQKVNYPSQRENFIGRASRAIKKIEARLATGESRTDGKPKGMRWRNYFAITDRKAELEIERDERFWAYWRRIASAQ